MLQRKAEGLEQDDEKDGVNNPTRASSAFLRGLCAVCGKFAVLTQKDVKNEDRSDYVYENKGERDKLSSEKQGFLQENATIAR
jgi:hypothetical protein